MSKTSAVIKYAGSKQRIADWIISNFPDNYKNLTYLEPFFGSGSVFFRKEPSEIETINDRSSDITNLFTQIRDNHDKLIHCISNTPWSRDEYNLSCKHAESDLENARRFLVRMWFSIGGNTYRINGMRMNIADAGNGSFRNFYHNIKAAIKLAQRRLLHDERNTVQIENMDALRLIPKYSRSNVLMYLDPPYLLLTRKHKKIYQHEMTDSDHEALLKTIVNTEGYILLSGYDNDLYNTWLSKWKVERITGQDEAGNKRTECLWMNYACRQYYLFPGEKLF